MGKKNEVSQVSYELLQGMERRFKKIAGLANEDLTPFPIKQVSNQEINKDKSKEFGEVFTPLWLVDSMIKQAKIKQDYTTLDLCAGYGQFSIRLFRAYFLKFRKSDNFDFKAFIKRHCFAELQLSSCFKLLRIFGLGINLFIGDAMQLGKVPENANGIWLYVEEADRWVCITKSIKKMISGNEVDANGNKLPVSEAEFVKKVETLTAYLNATPMAFAGKKYDVVLSNPPYNRGLDLKILQALMGAKVAKEYVIVHPSTWLLDRKDKTPLYANIKALISGKLKSIKLFNGNPIFNISLMLPCAITHIDCSFNSSNTKVTFFDEEFVVENTYDITKFGKDWLTIVKPFVSHISSFISRYGNVWQHNSKTIDPKLSYCQAAVVRGHVSLTSTSMVENDFYTILIGIEECKGIRQPNLDRPGNPQPTFGFNTDVERDNFLNYLCTDFARFCFAIYKNNGNLAVGEMELIPWLDFTQSWDDEKLFAHFNVDSATQDYIRAFLPDYYGIRKSK
jgi:hypothetical protein